MSFLGSLLKYVIQLAFMVAVAGLGLFAGKKLRDNKDAKAASQAVEETSTQE